MDPLLCMNYRMKPFTDLYDKELYEDIKLEYNKKILYESYGLSDEVLNKAKDIIKHITYDIKNNKKSNKDEYGKYVIDNQYVTNLPENHTLIIKYKCIYFIDKLDYLENLKNYELIYTENNINDDEIEIVLTIPIAGNKIPVKYFNEPLYHELTHAYESIKRGGGFFGSEENANYYYNLTKDIMENNGDPKYIKVARCIYACYKFERNAFLHSIYSYLIQYNTLETSYLYDKFKESAQYSYLLDIKQVIDYPKYYEKEIKELTGQNYETFKKYIEKQYKKYISSIGKIMQRIVIDNMGNIPKNQFNDIDDILNDII